jgi:aminoglycoside phosphotransferase (APT) family kinase protein
VLVRVDQIATPTPRLIGVDPTGAQAGGPVVLMSELDGRPDWSAGQRWIRQLVEVLDDVHAIDAATASSVSPFTVYAQESFALPKWVTKPDVWERAIEIFNGPVLDEDRTFIHRDFYPGNVLWCRRVVTGLVDWESASVGPRSMVHRLLPLQPVTRTLRRHRGVHTRVGAAHRPDLPSVGRHRHDHRAPRLPAPPPASRSRTIRN